MSKIGRWVLGRRQRTTIAYADPLKAGRHPFQTYILAASFITGLPLIFGQVAPGSLEDNLPPALVASWGIMLVGGCGLALFGSYWGDEARFDSALTLERIGLVFAGMAAFVYGVTIMIELRSGGLIAGGMIVGFGLAAMVRATDLGAIFTRALDPHPRSVDKEEGR